MAPAGLMKSVQLGAEEFAGGDVGCDAWALPSKLAGNAGPAAGAAPAGASSGAKHRSRRARTLRVIILGHVVEEGDGRRECQSRYWESWSPYLAYWQASDKLKRLELVGPVVELAEMRAVLDRSG